MHADPNDRDWPVFPPLRSLRLAQTEPVSNRSVAGWCCSMKAICTRGEEDPFQRSGQNTPRREHFLRPYLAGPVVAMATIWWPVHGRTVSLSVATASRRPAAVRPAPSPTPASLAAIRGTAYIGMSSVWWCHAQASTAASRRFRAPRGPRGPAVEACRRSPAATVWPHRSDLAAADL